MEIIVCDFETYYDKDYSLSKLTTEEYIRSDLFEVIGVGIQVGTADPEWASGSHTAIKKYLDQFDWDNTLLIAHNAMFDASILSWIFDIHPKMLACTLCMGRAVHGTEVGGSLAALAKRYGLEDKGTFVSSAISKHRKDFTEGELSDYGDYCIHDVELCYELFKIIGSGVVSNSAFPREELKVIDMTLRMFTEPVLDLDVQLLNQHLVSIKEHKQELLDSAGVDKKALMSGDKFAELLTLAGIDPPTKISPTNPEKTIWAFAKSDKQFTELLEHEDLDIQTLVAARLGNKSTLEETRTERFISIASRGLFPVPLKYYAAHTGRWGGFDKVNLQNLPNRGTNAKQLKRSIIAPPGYILIDADSAQIEARVLAWLAGHDALVTAFARGDDVYVAMATTIYGKQGKDITSGERFVGKSTILGAGYGMGAERFREQLRNMGMGINLTEARRIISVYRHTHKAITLLWNIANEVLRSMCNKAPVAFGRNELIRTNANSAFNLPSGLLLRYDDLHCDLEGNYSYKTRRGRTKIYGGKVVENLCQALARCIIAEQMLKITERYRIVLTVHDSAIACVWKGETEAAVSYIEQCMQYVPDWAEGLPLACEIKVGPNLGDMQVQSS
jgi:hypothetical protein